MEEDPEFKLTIYHKLQTGLSEAEKNPSYVPEVITEKQKMAERKAAIKQQKEERMDLYYWENCGMGPEQKKQKSFS